MYKFETNVDLEFTDKALENIAIQAKEKRIGARGLRTIIEEVLEDVNFEYPSIKGLTKVVINDDLTHEYRVEDVIDSTKVIDLDVQDEATNED